MSTDLTDLTDTVTDVTDLTGTDLTGTASGPIMRDNVVVALGAPDNVVVALIATGGTTTAPLVVVALTGGRRSAVRNGTSLAGARLPLHISRIARASTGPTLNAKTFVGHMRLTTRGSRGRQSAMGLSALLGSHITSSTARMRLLPRSIARVTLVRATSRFADAGCKSETTHPSVTISPSSPTFLKLGFAWLHLGLIKFELKTT